MPSFRFDPTESFRLGETRIVDQHDEVHQTHLCPILSMYVVAASYALAPTRVGEGGPRAPTCRPTDARGGTPGRGMLEGRPDSPWNPTPTTPLRDPFPSSPAVSQRDGGVLPGLWVVAVVGPGVWQPPLAAGTSSDQAVIKRAKLLCGCQHRKPPER